MQTKIYVRSHRTNSLEKYYVVDVTEKNPQSFAFTSQTWMPSDLERTFCVLTNRPNGGSNFCDLLITTAIQTQPPYLYVATLKGLSGEFPPDKDAELQKVLAAAEPKKTFRIVPAEGEPWFKDAHAVSLKEGRCYFHQLSDLSDFVDFVEAAGIKSVEPHQP